MHVSEIIDVRAIKRFIREMKKLNYSNECIGYCIAAVAENKVPLPTFPPITILLEGRKELG